MKLDLVYLSLFPRRGNNSLVVSLTLSVGLVLFYVAIRNTLVWSYQPIIFYLYWTADIYIIKVLMNTKHLLLSAGLFYNIPLHKSISKRSVTTYCCLLGLLIDSLECAVDV